tara:strand:- start:821 stop:1432 length:612 start_codon:yes stop_codon:yes gene_type:complete
MDSKYHTLCQTRGDINEHLPTLYKYAKDCESILELGVRGVVSSWAFIKGLSENEKNVKKILLNDIETCDIDEIMEVTKGMGVNISHEWKNDLELDIKENVDLTFIDTWHVYALLKRELEKFSKVTNKYIIMHDTTVDEWEGETIREHGGLVAAEKQSKETGFPVEEIMKGLWPAIEEFLETNKEWKLKERFTNNNGLTILERI